MIPFVSPMFCPLASTHWWPPDFFTGTGSFGNQGIVSIKESPHFLFPFLPSAGNGDQKQSPQVAEDRVKTPNIFSKNFSQMSLYTNYKYSIFLIKEWIMLSLHCSFKLHIFTFPTILIKHENAIP